MARRHFLSDNAAGIHPQVMAKINEANEGHQPAYGHDCFSAEAIDTLKKEFGANIEVFFTLTGTAANVIALQSVLRSFESVISADCAHIYMDECGAPEKFTGCKILPAKTRHGKLTPESIAPLLRDTAMVHRTQPKVVSIAQCTEWGTVYTPVEIRALADFCHDRDMLLHIDGARLCNAAAALDVPLRAITADAGVDILSFGGTKNGLMAAEAIIFFDRALADNTGFYRKQAMQLASKMRFVAAQFTALLEKDLWRQNARHANDMAALLAGQIGDIPGLEIIAPVETNAVFARIPPAWIKPLQAHALFAVWDSHESVVRWMTSFDTAAEDIMTFAAVIKNLDQEAYNRKEKTV